jgi:hypothetical protein
MLRVEDQGATPILKMGGWSSMLCIEDQPWDAPQGGDQRSCCNPKGINPGMGRAHRANKGPPPGGVPRGVAGWGGPSKSIFIKLIHIFYKLLFMGPLKIFIF